MNTAAITGIIPTEPRYRIRGFTPVTTFDVTVPFARRSYTFHVRALNDLAKTSRHWHAGDEVSVTGYLHAEPYDMPDRSVWHRVDIVAYEIDHRPGSERAERAADVLG